MKPRPFLRAAVDEQLPKIEKHLRKAMRKALLKASQSVADELRGKPSLIATITDPLSQAESHGLMTRDDAVEDVLGECCEAALAAGLGLGDGVVYADMEGQVRAILLTAANLWGIGRDQASESE